MESDDERHRREELKRREKRKVRQNKIRSQIAASNRTYYLRYFIAFDDVKRNLQSI